MLFDLHSAPLLITNQHQTPAHHLLQCLKSLYQNQQRSKMLFDFHFKADCTHMKQSSHSTVQHSLHHSKLHCSVSTLPHSIQCAYLVYCNHDNKKQANKSCTGCLSLYSSLSFCTRPPRPKKKDG